MLDKPRKGSGTTRKSAGRTPPAKGAARSQAAPPTVTDGAAPQTYLSSPKISSRVSGAERRRMIAEAAYYKAARRGFAPGDPDRDWIEAEAEIDAWLIER